MTYFSDIIKKEGMKMVINPMKILKLFRRKKNRKILVIVLVIFALLFATKVATIKDGKVSIDIPSTLIDVSKPSDVIDKVKEKVTSVFEDGYTKSDTSATFSYGEIPDYSGDPYYVVNNNVPYFLSEYKVSTKSFEDYSEFDDLGRCGVCTACIGQDIMPKEERGDISGVEPSGWRYNKKSNNNKYNSVDGKYIYNRCHLIGFQLAGENDNEYNLITGTRYLNVTGMLPFENMVADFVKETNNHVYYRVTPIFVGNELVARGVLMEAYSVEDKGEDVEFCVFCYNVQPGVEINYSTGQNWAS